MAKRVNTYTQDKGYTINEFVELNNTLYKCIQETPNPAGEFNPIYWLDLGEIVAGDGYIKIEEGDTTLSYDSSTFYTVNGGLLNGYIQYDLSNDTSLPRSPFRFVKDSVADGDQFILTGGNGSISIGSKGTLSSDSSLNTFGIANDGFINLVSSEGIKFITNGKSSANFVNALSINSLGDITVKSKASEVTNNSRAIATEAQVYALQQQLQSNVVTKTGNNEEITGSKIMYNLSSHNTLLLKEDYNLEGGSLKFQKANNDPLSADPYIDLSNGKIRFNGNNGSTTIPLEVDLYNNKVTTETPADNDKSNQLATTAWVQSVTGAQNVVHKDGTEDITGSKTFTTAPRVSATLDASDSTTKVATTAWVNNTNNNVVHKTDNEDITGEKTFTKVLNIKNDNITGRKNIINFNFGSDNKGSISVENVYSGFPIHFYHYDMTLSADYIYLNKTPTINNYGSNLIATTNYVHDLLKRTRGSETPVLHELMSNAPLGSGTIQLNQEFTNYPLIMVVITTDDQRRGGTYMIPTWELDWRMSQSSWTGGVLLACTNDIYWYIKNYAQGSTKTQFLTLSVENSVIQHIYGIETGGF